MGHAAQQGWALKCRQPTEWGTAWPFVLSCVKGELRVLLNRHWRIVLQVGRLHADLQPPGCYTGVAFHVSRASMCRGLAQPACAAHIQIHKGHGTVLGEVFGASEHGPTAVTMTQCLTVGSQVTAKPGLQRMHVPASFSEVVRSRGKYGRVAERICSGCLCVCKHFERHTSKAWRALPLRTGRGPGRQSWLGVTANSSTSFYRPVVCCFTTGRRRACDGRGGNARRGLECKPWSRMRQHGTVSGRTRKRCMGGT